MKKIFALVLIIAFSFAMPVIAEAFHIEEWDRLEGENHRLREQINNLQRQLTDAMRPQPTPRPPQNPNIRLVGPQSIVMVPGEYQYIDISVRNIGNGVASNALVTASSDGPFHIEFLNNSNILGNVAVNSTNNVRVRLTADSSAPADTYLLNLQFAFRDRDGNNDTSTDIISVRIDAHTVMPRITLRNFAINSAQILPGDSFVITAQLANLGEGPAYNVQAAIYEGLDSEGIFLSGSPNNPFLQTVDSDHSSMISFPFQASDRISSGTFPIVFELTGRDHAGGAISERFTYFVTVIAPAGGDNRAFITLSASAPDGATGVNGHVPVYVQVTNTGSLTARNIRVDATPADDSAIVPQSTPVQIVPSLEPGDSATVHFAFSPTADAGSHYHMIGFEVTYDIGIADESDSFQQFVGINVYNPDEDERRSRPRMLVSTYSVYPIIVSAGEEFDLSLTFLNTSSEQSVHNIKITLEAVEHEDMFGAVFTPVGASNTIFIDSLGPREESVHMLRVFTVPNADPRTYNIEVTFEYEDSNFEELTETEQISIPVRQITRLEVNNVQIPSHAMAFQPVFVDFNIINSGRVPLANLRVAMLGDFDTQGMDIFAGNMGRGNSASFSGQFTPFEPGEHQGVLVVSGEDAIGELIEVRHEFILFVDDMPAWDDDMMWDDDMRMGDWDDGMDMPASGFFGGIWMWVIGALVVVGLGAAGAIYMIRRKKNNQDIFQDLQ